MNVLVSRILGLFQMNPVGLKQYMNKQELEEIGMQPVEIDQRTNFRTDSLNEYPSLSAPKLHFTFQCTANHRRQDCITADRKSTGSSSYFCKKCGGITVLQIREE